MMHHQPIASTEPFDSLQRYTVTFEPAMNGLRKLYAEISDVLPCNQDEKECMANWLSDYGYRLGLERLLSLLTVHEATIVVDRFGVDDCKPKTFVVIGDRLNKDPVEIRDTCNWALQKLSRNSPPQDPYAELLEQGRFAEIPVDALGLSERVSNCLYRHDIKDVSALLIKTEDGLLNLPNFGAMSLNEVQERLFDIGLHLS